MSKHTTIRLSQVARERLERLSPDYDSNTAAIEEGLERLELSRIAFGQQVQRATVRLISAVKSADEAAIGAAQMVLAELLHSLPAAIGITEALRNT